MNAKKIDVADSEILLLQSEGSLTSENNYKHYVQKMARTKFR